MQELDDMTLLRVHQIDTFRLFITYISEMPASFSQGNPKLSRIQEFPVAIAGASLSPARKRKTY
jgi:hypothetical protein